MAFTESLYGTERQDLVQRACHPLLQLRPLTAKRYDSSHLDNAAQHALEFSSEANNIIMTASDGCCMCDLLVPLMVFNAHMHGQGVLNMVPMSWLNECHTIADDHAVDAGCHAALCDMEIMPEY